MRWYYTIEGDYTDVRVFMNGAKCGSLTFRNEEFERIKKAQSIMEIQHVEKVITFIAAPE